MKNNDTHEYEFEVWRDGVFLENVVTVRAKDSELRSKIKRLREKRYPPEEFFELKNCRVLS
jgi:hypothetical protein